LLISIYESDGNLIVKNNIQPKTSLKKSSGIGLLNIKQRYALLTSREISVWKDSGSFEVRLPLLTKQISFINQEKSEIMESKAYEKMKRAHERVEEIKGFYGNLTAYCIVVPFLAIINLLTSSDFLWFFFPMIGWGIGVSIHYMAVFGKNPFFGKDWEERKIREFMEEEK
jgi:hypothetical protein